MTTDVPTSRGTPSRVDLELLPIDERSWRLCDPRWRPSDAPYVVAYIEHLDEQYDVVWMRGARRRARVSCLDECLRLAREQLAQDIVPGTRPIEIPHFPPPRSA